MAYGKVIADHVEKGYVQKLNGNDPKEPGHGWYLPHFGIVKPDKATTKIRIVFDASVRCEGQFLNKLILPGPKLQNSDLDVLLRLRRCPVALVSDVTEMYLRIGLQKSDRCYHRFLWRDCDQTRPPEVYKFNWPVFGVNSCPFQAQYVTQTHARRHADKWPRTAETFLKSTYMDDSLDSVESEEDAIQLYQQLAAMWHSAGMPARKWLSKSANVLRAIPEVDQAE